MPPHLGPVFAQRRGEIFVLLPTQFANGVCILVGHCVVVGLRAMTRHRTHVVEWVVESVVWIGNVIVQELSVQTGGRRVRCGQSVDQCVGRNVQASGWWRGWLGSRPMATTDPMGFAVGMWERDDARTRQAAFRYPATSRHSIGFSLNVLGFKSFREVVNQPHGDAHRMLRLAVKHNIACL